MGDVRLRVRESEFAGLRCDDRIGASASRTGELDQWISAGLLPGNATAVEGFSDFGPQPSNIQITIPPTQGARHACETNYRMQMSVPGVVDIKSEPEHIRRSYGLDRKETAEFGRQCLMARRLIEDGVRFVQIFSGGWDSHDYLEKGHSSRINSVDQPIAALIKDLKQRGMLEDTLVVWTGEFGRTPDNNYRGGVTSLGRGHNADAMNMWFAGGGTKAGAVVGATDEIGAEAVDCVHPIRDVHITMLHLLGLDDNKLTYFHAGRYKQLSQFGGELIPELIG